MPRPSPSPAAERRVLHLVDRITGGVPVAVRTYIEHSPDGYAHTVASPFVEGVPAPVWAGLAAAHRPWDTSSAPRALVGLRALLHDGRYDVVHAHSSFPGVYARLVTSRRRTRLVYTPHCFAFVRTDVGTLRRAGFRVIEAALAHRTSVLAACGAGELAAAVAVGLPRERALEVPNIASLPAAPASRRRHPAGALRVGMLGRWAPQKDPAFFVETLARLRGAVGGTPVEGTWIGDGGTRAADGIRVTGWVSPADVRRELEALDVYLHTAAWEGFPIALLDADATGCPMLARRIDALPGLPVELTIEHGLDALAHAVRSGGFADWSTRNRTAWARYLGARAPMDQTRALARAWGDQASPRTSAITSRTRRADAPQE